MSVIKELCIAARRGDINAVRNYLKQYSNLDLNQTAEYFESNMMGTAFFSADRSSVPSMYLGPCTPLMIAAAYKHQDIVKLLVESGRVDVNFQGGRDKDHTALDCAKKWGTKEIVHYLQEQNGKYSVSEELGYSGFLQLGKDVVQFAGKEAFQYLINKFQETTAIKQSIGNMETIEYAQRTVVEDLNQEWLQKGIKASISEITNNLQQ